MKAATSFTCLLLASVALLSSCDNSGKKEQASGQNELLAVNYGDLSKEKVDLPLSTFVEDVQVIHFENIDDAFFKAWNIVITDHYIGVRQSGVPFGDECKGHWVITASTKNKPQVVGIDNINCELAPSDIYSGMYGRVTIRFFGYSNSGNKGIGCGLGNVLKTRDGEPLSGQASAASDFAGIGAAPTC